MEILQDTCPFKVINTYNCCIVYRDILNWSKFNIVYVNNCYELLSHV